MALYVGRTGSEEDRVDDTEGVVVAVGVAVEDGGVEDDPFTPASSIWGTFLREAVMR